MFVDGWRILKILRSLMLVCGVCVFIVVEVFIDYESVYV